MDDDDEKLDESIFISFLELCVTWKRGLQKYLNIDNTTNGQDVHSLNILYHLTEISDSTSWSVDQVP